MKVTTTGTVTQVQTKAAKGGSIIVKIEIPLIREGAELVMKQNKDCAVELDFSTEKIEEVQGQLGLEFEGGEGDPEEREGT